MAAVQRLNGFGLGLLLAAFAVGSGEPAFAEIRASGKNGLKTEVNGQRGGRCTKGVCRIGGGTKAGKNTFHRFKNFDTRGAIKQVKFDTGGQRNLVVGVTSTKGTWIDKAVTLSSKANLYFLSPGGIYLGKGAGFINAPKLSLSTADQLHFAEGVFDVFQSKPNNLRDFTTNPLPGVFGMRRSEVEEPVVLKAGQLPGIHLDGINISLDEELLVDAPGGRVDVSGSRLDVGTQEVGGRIALSADAIDVDDESALIAGGTKGGELIEVGGSWQNSDAGGGYKRSSREADASESVEAGVEIAEEGTGPGNGPGAEGPGTGPDNGPGEEGPGAGPDNGPGAEGPGTGPDNGPGAEGPGTGPENGPGAEGPGTGPGNGPEAEGPGTGPENGPGAEEPGPGPGNGPDAEEPGPGSGLGGGISLPASEDEEGLLDSILLAQSSEANPAPTVAMPLAPNVGRPGGPGVDVQGVGGPDVGGPGDGPGGGLDSGPESGPAKGGSPRDGDRRDSDRNATDSAGSEVVSEDSESSPKLEGGKPAALTPPSLSGNGYEVNLSLDSSFQIADSGTPSLGAGVDNSSGAVASKAVAGGLNATGSKAGGASRASTEFGVSEGGLTAVRSEGSAASAAVSEGSTSEASSVSDGERASAAVSEGSTSEASSVSDGERASAATEDGGEEAASGDGSGGEESGSGDAVASESADAAEESGDGGEKGAGGESAEGDEGPEEGGGEGAEDGGDEGGDEASGESEEGDGADNDDAGREGGTSKKPKEASAALAVKRVDAKRASENLASGDAKATSQTLQGLNLPDLRRRSTPTPAAIVNSLQQARQRIRSGATALKDI